MPQALRTVPRQTANNIFRAGVAAAHGSKCVAAFLQEHPLSGPVCLIGIGKAASAMTIGAIRRLDEQIIRGLVVTKQGHADRLLARDGRFHLIESGHPLPNNDSLLAGSAVCRFLDKAPADAGFLILISGGASSLVEVLQEGIDLEGLIRANRWLLGSGLDIAAVNRVRRALSRIKGGGLLAFLRDRQTTVLLVSDVVGDDPAIIGSGLLMPAVAAIDESVNLPGWLAAMLAGPGAVSRSYDSPCHHVVATIDTALAAAARYSQESGLAVSIMNNRLAGDAQLAGAEIAKSLKEMPAGVYLWGGETTVKLPVPAGTGGRNQQLALAAAAALSQHKGIVVLAAGTDGTDGPTEYAGAIVDSSTIERGQAKGCDATTCLLQADAGAFLGASGDLLVTGPTGTNVMDMVIGYKPAIP